MENSKDRNRKSKSRGFAGGSVNKTNVRSGAPAASKGKMPAGASARQEKRSAEGGERLRRAPKNIRFARSAAIGCAKTANAASVLKETVSKIPYSAIAGGARILAAFFVGMLFSRRDMLFSTYPLAIAGVSAFAEQLVPFAVGAFAGGVSTGDTGYVYSAVCVIITAVRLFLSLYEREKKNARAAFFDQPLKVRLYIAALGAFFCGIYCIIRNEYRYYDLFGSLFLLAVTPVLSWMFFQLEDSAEARGGVWRLAAVMGTAGALLYSLKGIAVLGISASYIAAAVFVICAACLKGVLFGTASGVFFGIIAAPACVPAFSVIGFLYGLIPNAHPAIAGAVSVSGAVAATLLSYGGGAVLQILPELVLGAGINAVLVNAGVLDRLECALDVDTGEFANSKQKRVLNCEERFEALSESFRSLSEMCYALSDRYRRPDEPELRALCDNVCDKYCGRCRSSPLCWNREYSSTADVMGKVVGTLADGKKLTRGSLPMYFSLRCPSVDGIIKEINDGCAQLTENRLKGNKSEVLAMDYEAIAALINQALEAGRAEYSEDPVLSAKLTKESRAFFKSSGSVTVTGKRRLSVVGSGYNASGIGGFPRELHGKMERICGCKLTLPVYTVDRGFISFSAERARRYTAQISFLCRSKELGEQCGDRISVFENREDYFYAMLSDGMGSGSEAALTSGVCTVFLKKMLSAGNAKNVSIEMLNDLVRASGGECSATVDLFELDMLSGRASFVKSGAAPSFIKRGGRLFRVQSKTLPIGIMRAAEAEQVKFDAEDGDCIIMQSDGVAQSYEDCPWLFRLLSRSWDEDLKKMCARILDAAEQNNPDKDDRSVCIIKITEL